MVSSRRPLTAWLRGVWYQMSSRALTSAPLLTRSSTTSGLPLPAAIHRAETPYSLRAFTSAPFSSAAWTALTSPPRTAAQSASRFGSAAVAAAARARRSNAAIARRWDVTAFSRAESARTRFGRRNHGGEAG